MEKLTLKKEETIVKWYHRLQTSRAKSMQCHNEKDFSILHHSS